MSDIKINIIGEFNKKGFTEAEKATGRLTANFDKLRSSARRTFATIVGYQALKRSVQAFAAEDKAIQNLTKSLDNLGFRFEAPGVVTYLENLEKATAVSKDELFPAFRNLSNATLDLQKSQELLGLALDISAGTGNDLYAVTTALTKAYNGNYGSLGKVQNAYTMAELKAMGFSEAVKVLNDEFSGQSGAAANTYAAKIDRLNIAIGDAAENIGKGLVDAFEALGGGNYDEGLELIATAGEKIGDAFRFAAKGVAYFKRFWKQGLFATSDQLAEFNRDMMGMYSEDPAKARTALRERAKYLESERKQTDKIRKSREAAAKLAEKEKKNRLAIEKAKGIFDLEKIQIEAALKGKITEEERTRLLLMKAIAEENGTEATKLSEKLKDLQNDTIKLANMLTSFPEANDPFTNWLNSLESIKGSLAFILGITNANSLAARSSASQGDAAMLMGDAYAASAEAGGARIDALSAIDQANALIAAATTPEELAIAQEALAAANASLDAADTLDDSALALLSAAASLEELAAANLLGESVATAYSAGVPTSEININVYGSIDPYGTARAIADTINLEATTSGSFGALGYSQTFGVA
jgi:hypothetical protein